MNEQQPAPVGAHPGVGPLARSAGLGTGAALVGNTVVYLVARAADLDLVVAPPGQSPDAVPYGAVVGAVVVAGVAAFVGAVVLGRVRHGWAWFTGFATLALLGSFASPVGAAEETSTALVLSLMHLVVAVALVPTLARRLRGGRS